MIQGTMMGDMFSIWLSVQKQLANVERWGTFRSRNPHLRKQSTLAHQFSICVVLMPVLLELKKYYIELDTELVKDAFLLHDIPEGLLKMKKDIQSNVKKDHHDLSEYIAFERYFSHLPRSIYDHMHTAYVLQFANKTDTAIDILPEAAKQAVSFLRSHNPYEVKLFSALEHWEYLFYAYEGYIHRTDEVLFMNVLRGQMPRLQKHAKEIAGFREVLFPLSFEKNLLDFMEKHKDVLVFQ